MNVTSTPKEAERYVERCAIFMSLVTLLFRRRMFDQEISGIRREATNLIVVMKDQDRVPESGAAGLFNKLTHNKLTQNIIDKYELTNHEQAAIWTYRACNETLAHLYPGFTERLLSNRFFQSVHEVDVCVKQCYVIGEAPDISLFGKPYQHCPSDNIHVLYKVTDYFGKAWALDMTGAQHGQYMCYLPWDEYRNTMIDNSAAAPVERNLRHHHQALTAKLDQNAAAAPDNIRVPRAGAWTKMCSDIAGCITETMDRANSDSKDIALEICKASDLGFEDFLDAAIGELKTATMARI